MQVKIEKQPRDKKVKLHQISFDSCFSINYLGEIHRRAYKLGHIVNIQTGKTSVYSEDMEVYPVECVLTIIG